MPRVARIVRVGMPHHVTQRGNFKQNVFVEDKDRRTYLYLLDQYCEEYRTKIICYCLMSNHVHFIAIPGEENSLARTFNCTHFRYSQYFNAKNKQKGHLWQGRFYSCILDGFHLPFACRYVERNPVRSGLVSNSEQWMWSSANEHCTGRSGILKLYDMFSVVNIPKSNWKKALSDSEDHTSLTAIRKNTIKGFPFMEESSLKELEKVLGRPLKPNPVGRPSTKLGTATNLSLIGRCP
ncbi:MAG: hypothetical protein A2452_00490 [Candidatus Firestonebacteria bacterium RIFOXYC2_FULL_39_67]|nr:MAG: hypothetical protein A2536_03575 [Candidatus Firestonebacteria bacterium RIFOXYD2_FULL_39_29]OGF54910.1 MAG: hypothetical protein A2452_00490 [Candidatus Firestonebacteria bacterium RIFOXYC2_FULL_39_67]OGF57744.1 MAG: hypothetical protein A2497_03895 [Candidatus Firestonebacteria bacterium RifOxyC12_full_39_7]